MQSKLKFYGNISKSFEEFYSSEFLKSLNIAFSEEFFLNFSQQIEQVFEEIFQIYRKYFRELCSLDFDNFLKEYQKKGYNSIKETTIKEKSILTSKIHANFKSKSETNNKLKQQNFHYEFDESSFENTAYENKDQYKILLNNFDTDKNTSHETVKTAKNNSFFPINSSLKNESFYSYPQNNKKSNLKKNEDFVIKNVEKIKKKQVVEEDSRYIPLNISSFKTSSEENNKENVISRENQQLLLDLSHYNKRQPEKSIPVHVT